MIPGTEAKSHPTRRLTFFKPVESESDYRQAMAIIDDLLSRPRLSRREDEYLAALSLLVEIYEREHFEVEDIHGVEMLKALMELHGLKQKDLVPALGTRSLVSEVLAGKRDLSKQAIVNLARLFQVSPAVFLPGIETKTTED
ncbi:MAG TPA: helix-turn-helix domain-containing protein [Oscillatoriaceae cyanobacterium]